MVKSLDGFFGEKQAEIDDHRWPFEPPSPVHKD